MADKSSCARICSALMQTTVEPFLFFVLFGYTVRVVSMQSMLMDRSCRLLLNYSNEICDDIDNDKYELQQSLAVKYGNNFYIGVMIISTLPALVVATFLGPWSDRYSRKYPLIIASSGVLVDACICAILTSMSHISPYWFLLSAIPSGLSGGIIMVMSSTYSYLSDVTTERSRPTRYAILESFTILSLPTGSLIGGQLYKTGGYFAVMITAPCSIAVGVLWAIFYVKETKPKIYGVTIQEMFRNLFTLDNIKASFKTCTQERPGNLRFQIWMIIFASCCVRIIHMGSFSIGFPFTKLLYKWGVTRYSNAWALMSVLYAVATASIVPILNKKLMLHEAAVGLIGVFSLMSRMIVTSVAFEQEWMYYAWICGMFYACSNVSIRSRISKLVSKQELGRVFSLLATCESLTPVLGTFLFLQIFNLSSHVYPGLIFALSAIFLLPPAMIFIWLMTMPTMSFSQYVESQSQKNMKELKNVTSGNFQNLQEDK